MSYNRRALWLTLLALAIPSTPLVVGCGGDDPPAEVSSDDIVRELRQEQRDQRRLSNLQRGIDQLKEQERERAGTPRRPDETPSPSLDSITEDLGEVGVVVGHLGSSNVQRGGGLTTGSAWSTIKVPIALSLLRDVGGPGNLTPSQRGQIEAAITLSDNAAAVELYSELERRHGGNSGAAAAVTGVLRAGGDTSTSVSTQGRDGFSTYGQTEWSLANQQLFMAGLANGCLGDRASTDFVLDLMGRVTSDRWGLGSLVLPTRWKGGWGPGVDGRYLVRQMGIVERGGEQLVIAIAAQSTDGQFLSGQALATRLAQRAIEKAEHLSEPSGTTC